MFGTASLSGKMTWCCVRLLRRWPMPRTDKSEGITVQRPEEIENRPLLSFSSDKFVYGRIIMRGYEQWNRSDGRSFFKIQSKTLVPLSNCYMPVNLNKLPHPWLGAQLWQRTLCRW
jgi:hypothetical protein